MPEDPRKDRVTRRAHGVALRQGGVVSRQQLHEEGLSRHVLERQIRAGLWRPVGRRVLVVPGAPWDLRTRSIAAVLAAGPVATVSGMSVPALCGRLDQAPWDAVRCPLDPWVVADRHVRLPVPARVFRRAPDPVHVLSGCPAESWSTVMTDLLRFLPEQEAVALGYRAVGMPAWQSYLDRLPQLAVAFRGRRGVRQLALIANAVSTGARSRGESRVHEILAAAGISGWRPNFTVRIAGRKYILDVAFEAEKVAIEFDGRAFHGDDRFQSDRTRQNDLVAAGWIVLRFTWDDVMVRPGRVVSVVKTTLGSRRPPH